MATAMVHVGVLCAYYTFDHHNFVIEIIEKVESYEQTKVSAFWVKAPVTSGRISCKSSSMAFMFRQTVRDAQAYYTL